MSVLALLVSVAFMGCPTAVTDRYILESDQPVEACSDGVIDGDETDVDCGGPDCPRCDIEDDCAIDGDCASNVCADGTCAGLGCSDERWNGDESDVDCGGGCLACGTGFACGADVDCASGQCSLDICE